MQQKQWIEATVGDGSKVWLNMAEARSLEPDGDYTRVHFGKEHWVGVTETPAQLLAAIGVMK